MNHLIIMLFFIYPLLIITNRVIFIPKLWVKCLLDRKYHDIVDQYFIDIDVAELNRIKHITR